MILSRPRLLPQERFDLEDLNALLSAARTDSHLYTKEFLSSQNYIIKGFSVSGIGLKAATVNMADATLIIPQSTTDFSWYTASPTEANIVIPDADLADGTRNYVELQLFTQNQTTLTRAFWDPEANSGAGQEFNQVVDTITHLTLKAVVSTGGFSGSADKLPLCIIDTDPSGNIKTILDRRNLFHRLAKPNDINNSFTWAGRTEPAYSMTLTGVSGTFLANEPLTINTETATCVTGGTTSITFNAPSGINFFPGSTVTGGTSGATGTLSTVLESFTGADKSIGEQKQLFDALMTEIKIMKGTSYWYQNQSLSLAGMNQAINSLFVQGVVGAQFYWDGSNFSIKDTTIGSPAASDVLGYLRILGRSGNLSLCRQDGTGGSAVIPVADGQVLYIALPATGARTYTGVGSTSTNFQVAALTSYVANDTNYWIAYREGARIYVRGYGELDPLESVIINDPMKEVLQAQIDAHTTRLNGVEAEVIPPFNITANPSSRVVNVGASRVSNPNTGKSHTVAPLGADVPNFTSGTITFPAASGGTIAVSPGNNAVLTLGVGQFAKCTVYLDPSANLNVLVGTPAASEALATTVAAPSGTLAIGYITVQNVGGTIQNIASSNIYQYVGTGGGSSSGSGVGDDLASLTYKASFTDQFADLPSSANSSIDSTTAKTDATLFSPANKYFRLAYDASKTVTGVGLSMIMSGSPGFTVKNGDLLRVGTEVRRITNVASQSSYAIESAFSVDPTSAACTVSQAVYTKDLNAFAADGVAIGSIFTTPITSALVTYNATTTAGDVLYNYSSPAFIAYSASMDGVNYSTVQAREPNPAASSPIVNAPVQGTNLYLRFFANLTSGSGFVNLVGYKVFFHRDSVIEAGGLQAQAYGMTSQTGAQVNCTISTVNGKTRIVFNNFTYVMGLNSGTSNGQLIVHLDGKKIPRYVNSTTTPDASYTEVSANIIDLDQDYRSLNLSVDVTIQTSVVDSNNQNTTDIVSLQTSATDGTQNYVATPVSMTAVSSAGAVGSSTFYSSITKRSSIPNISQDLRVTMGQERFPIQDMFELQNEFGPNGERIFGLINDPYNLVRFAGSGWVQEDAAFGARIITQTAGDFMEIVFYGTGLNILNDYNVSANDIRVSIDGGTEGSNIWGFTQSAVISNRQYAPNTYLPIVSGLPLGIHTAKIRLASGSWFVPGGYEVLNETSNITVNPGVAYINGKKVVAATKQTLAYNAPVTGTRGGRVVVYLKPDGTIGQAWQATNGAQANLTLADHTNEDVIRVYNPREFGAGRSDDMSLLASTTGNKAFTLDDGTATLSGNAVGFFFITGNIREGAGFAAGAVLDITFVGTGLDILEHSSPSASTTPGGNVYVDSVLIGSYNQAPGSKIRKLVSGLPYGTHTVRIENGATAFSDYVIAKYFVYGPKKPSIPAGSMELAEYNVMATYSPNTTTNPVAIATGVLRKTGWREITYFEGTGGTVNWSLNTPNSATFCGANESFSDRAAAAVQYWFFGTGVELRTYRDTNRGTAINVTIDGLAATTTNFPSLLTSTAGFSYNSTTGVLNSSGAAQAGCGVSLYNLPLGWHYVKFTNPSATTFSFDSLDVITPIHYHKLNTGFGLQNTIAIGSTGIGDLRKTTISKEFKLKNVAQAVGVTSAPTITSTTLIPMPDMSVTHYNTTGKIRVRFNGCLGNSVSGSYTDVAIIIDGMKVSNNIYGPTTGVASQVNTVVMDQVFNVAPNTTHKVDIYWVVGSGTGVANGTQRILIVEECEK